MVNIKQFVIFLFGLHISLASFAEFTVQTDSSVVMQGELFQITLAVNDIADLSTLNIDPIKVTCSIRVNNQRNRRDPFSNFFNSYNVREEMISSKPIYVNVKELPQPDAAFNQAYGDLGQTKMDLIQGTLGAQFSDFDFNLPVIVTSFDIQVRGQLISNQGSELSPQAKGAIGAAPSGSVLSVENIKTAAIGSNVQVKDAKSFALIIN